MLPRLLLSAVLVGHAAIHAGFVSPKPTTAGGPPWPFSLDNSWLLTRLGVDASLARGLGMALLVILLAGYATAILSSLGVIGSPMFSAGIVAGSVASLVLLIVFFHPWLVVGVALDVATLVAVLVADWRLEPLP